MAPHSSTLAWKIPWTEESGRLQSMGSLGVRHNWAVSLSLFSFMHWRRKWQPTLVFLPWESQGRGSLVGGRLWGRMSWARLSDFTFTFYFHALEKEMATHSRVLAWRIPGMGKPGGRPSMGSHRVGHDWSDLAAACVCVCTRSINTLGLFFFFLLIDISNAFSLGEWTTPFLPQKKKERKSKKLFIPLEKMSKGNRIFVRVMVITKGIYLTKSLK